MCEMRTYVMNAVLIFCQSSNSLESDRLYLHELTHSPFANTFMQNEHKTSPWVSQKRNIQTQAHLDRIQILTRVLVERLSSTGIKFNRIKYKVPLVLLVYDN